MAENTVSFDEFMSAPSNQEVQRQEPATVSPASYEDFMASAGNEPSKSKQPIEGGPEAEGIAGTSARNVAHEIGPFLGSLPAFAAGAKIGAAGGLAVAPFLGPAAPVAPVVGGLLGGAALGIPAAMGLSKLQEEGLKVVGYDDQEQRRVNAEANPTTDIVSRMAPQAIAFGPGVGAKVAERLLAGGAFGGFDVAQQLVEKGNVDWKEAGISTAMGAAFTRPRGFTERLNAPGTALGERLIGQKGRDAIERSLAAERTAVSQRVPATPDSKGTAASAPEPVEPEKGAIGNPKAENNEGVRDGGGDQYAKRPASINEQETGVSVGEGGASDPTIAAAIEQPKPEPPKTEQPAPAKPAAEEVLPKPVLGDQSEIDRLQEFANANRAEREANTPPPERKDYRPALEIVRAKFGDKAVEAIEARPDPVERQNFAINAARKIQTGGDIDTVAKNPRLNKGEAKSNILAQTEDGHYILRPDGNLGEGEKWVTAKDKVRAAKRDQALTAAAKVVNDEQFKPAENETLPQTRARAIAMTEAATETNGGTHPVNAYNASKASAPREWSLLKEAKRVAENPANKSAVLNFRNAEQLHADEESYRAFKSGKTGPQTGEGLVAKAEGEATKQGTEATVPGFQEAPKTPEEALIAKQEVERPKAKVETAIPEEEIELSDSQIADRVKLSKEASLAKMQAIPEWAKKNKEYKIAHPEEDPNEIFNAVMRKGILEPRTSKLMEGLEKAADDILSGKKGPVKEPTRLAMARAKMNRGEGPEWEPSKEDAHALDLLEKKGNINKKAAAEAKAKELSDKKEKLIADLDIEELKAAGTARQKMGNWFQRVLAPETVSALSRATAAVIREQGGITARALAQVSQMVEPYHPLVNNAPQSERVAFMKAVDTDTPVPKAEWAPLAKLLKASFAQVKDRLQALPSQVEQQFVTSYWPHMWENVEAAKKVIDAHYKQLKQGSSASLQERKYLTIQDGLDAGLKLKSDNPLQVAQWYLSSMHTFTENVGVLDRLQAAGIAQTITEKSMGASGHPEPGKIPEGMMKLNGRGSEGRDLYAPQEVATVYNNYISAGFKGNPESAKALDVMQRAANSVTMLELGISGYHAFTVGKEAIISKFALGLANTLSGDIKKGLHDMAVAIAEPYSSARRGIDPMRVYNGEIAGSPEMQRIMNLLTRAGIRAKGFMHDPTYQTSALPSFWTSFRRGAIRQEIADAKTRLGESEGVIGKTKQAANETFRLIGRSLQTVAQPLFEQYIPHIKLGVSYDQMSTWLDKNPTASKAEQMAAARRIVDSTDNRLGEMVHDNIFLNKALKQSAMLAMRSYTWNLGTVREIGLGTWGVLSHPERISIAHKDYDPRAAYVVAMPIVVAMTSMIYQYLKTGEGPKEERDLVTPRTGGKTETGRPERAMLPGYEKDVLGWFHSPSQEAANKLSTAPRLIIETLTNKDYKNQPIADERDPLAKRMQSYLMHVVESLGPISVKQMVKGEKTGSNITFPERATSIRPAPGYVQDPERYKAVMNKVNSSNWKRKIRSDAREAAKYAQ